MKLLAGFADPFGEFCFDEHMDIFRVRIEGQGAGFYISKDRHQSLVYLGAVNSRDDTLFYQCTVTCLY